MITICNNVFKMKLNSSAKLFYGYLQQSKALEKSNAHYADCFDVSTVSINNWLNELEDNNLIKLTYNKNKRKINLL